MLVSGRKRPQQNFTLLGKANKPVAIFASRTSTPPQAEAQLRVVVTDDQGYFYAIEPDDIAFEQTDDTASQMPADDDWRGSVEGSALTIDSAIYTNNRVGIGVEVPAYALDVQGDVRATGSLFASNQVITHATFATSDRRFKRDIQSYDNGLEQVRAMEPKQFRYTDDAPGGPSERLYYGLIAQEAASIDPNLVQSFNLPASTQPTAPTTYLGVDSQRLVFTLISAVKALDEKTREIDELRTRLEELEALVAPEISQGKALSARRFPASAFLNHSNQSLQTEEYF